MIKTNVCVLVHVVQSLFLVSFTQHICQHEWEDMIDSSHVSLRLQSLTALRLYFTSSITLLSHCHGFWGCRYSLPFLLSQDSWCMSVTLRLKKKKKKQLLALRTSPKGDTDKQCVLGVISRWIQCRNHISETSRWKHGSWHSLNLWLRQICVYPRRINTHTSQNCSHLVPTLMVLGLSI